MRTSHLFLVLTLAALTSVPLAGCAASDYERQLEKQREMTEHMRENKLGIFADPKPWTPAETATRRRMTNDLLVLEAAEHGFFRANGYFTLRLDELRPYVPADVVFQVPGARVVARYLPDQGRDGVRVSLQVLGNLVQCNIPILPSRKFQVECVK